MKARKSIQARAAELAASLKVIDKLFNSSPFFMQIADARERKMAFHDTTAKLHASYASDVFKYTGQGFNDE